MRERLSQTASGICSLVYMALFVYIVLTIQEYIVTVFAAMRAMLPSIGGLIVIAGILILQYVWVICRSFKWYAIVYGVLSGGIYFWWNWYVVPVMGQVITNTGMVSLDVIYSLKLSTFCAVIFLPSLVMCYYRRNWRDRFPPAVACIVGLIVWLGVCLLVAIPANIFWWPWVNPITPFVNNYILPDGINYYKAVKLIAGGNIVSYILIIPRRNNERS